LSVGSGCSIQASAIENEGDIPKGGLTPKSIGQMLETALTRVILRPDSNHSS